MVVCGAARCAALCCHTTHVYDSSCLNLVHHRLLRRLHSLSCYTFRLKCGCLSADSLTVSLIQLAAQLCNLRTNFLQLLRCWEELAISIRRVSLGAAKSRGSRAIKSSNVADRPQITYRGIN